MKVLLQQWRQREGPVLTSLCLDSRASRRVRHSLLFADDGVLPLAEPQWVELAPYATAAARITEEGYTFISEAELQLYVIYPGS